MRPDIESPKTVIIRDPIADPYKVTQAVRDLVSEGRRILDVSTHPNPGENGSVIDIQSEPLEIERNATKLPPISRPYKTSDSWKPQE